MKSVISSQSASFKFLHADEPFLKDINLEVSAGECLLICGESGSGKTTFSRLLNGVSPDYIEGELDGECYTYDLRAGETEIEEYVPVVGSVFQNPKTQHFTTNTSTELAFPCENMGMDPDDIHQRVSEVVSDFEIEELLDRDIFTLSGGEKQQIAFASANVLSPKVLVLDEVTSNLDNEAVEHLQTMIQQMKKEGVTVILTEHRLAWTKDIVDRYVLFEEGSLVKEWPAEEFNRLTNDELNSLGLRSMDLSSHKALINEKMQSKESNYRDSILQTKDLAVGYEKSGKVLDNLNLSFKAGETVGLMGANGTGKSTLASTITGLQRPLGGKVLWKDQLISSKELIKKSFLVMQDTNYQLFSDSVSDEVLLGSRYPEMKDEVLEQLGLTDIEDHHPMSLSGGQKQRVAIASAILSGKEILIFDEPTSGLDYGNMERFGRLLQELKESGIVVIVITHDEELAANWCDQIVYLEK